MAVEEPSYRVLLAESPFEHRLYTEFVVAETELTGDFDTASRNGFRRIASYIFGENALATGESKKIAMTAPVTVEENGNGWRLHFVMPATEKINTLPKPKNAEVRLRRIPEHEMVTVRFSGWTTRAAIQQQTEQLTAWAAKKNLRIAGSAQVARYDDPFTLPWRRRNEILIPIDR